MSSPAERLREIRLAVDAAEKTLDTLPDSATAAQRQELQDHVNDLDLDFYNTAAIALTATGQAVEAAYTAAVTARKAVEKALADAKGVAEKIRLVGKTVGTVGELIAKAKAL